MGSYTSAETQSVYFAAPVDRANFFMLTTFFEPEPIYSVIEKQKQNFNVSNDQQEAFKYLGVHIN